MVVSNGAIWSRDRENIFDRPIGTRRERRGRGGDLFRVHKVEMEMSDEE